MAHPDLRQPLLSLQQQLQSGAVTSRQLVDTALAAIDDPDGEGERAFLDVYHDRARAEADAADKLRAYLPDPPPLFGLPISIKDLFDVAGEVTKAGSTFLGTMPAAERDAPIIARLRAAGAILIGRTNMTEFAFSGLGVNAHYGTPGNAADRSRIPGGSSSGAAVSVTDGMAVAAIGTDTGGSVRIPSALCGLSGFKPTQRRVPLDGAVPLSFTLDSIGPLAHSVNCTAILDAVMAGEPVRLPDVRAMDGLRFAIPKNIVLDDADQTVADAFDKAVQSLSDAGASLTAITVPEFEDIQDLGREHGSIPAAEAWWWHESYIQEHYDSYDPRVVSRILNGRSITAAGYIAWKQGLNQIIANWHARIQPYDAVLMPTVPIVAPKLRDLDDLEAYISHNILLLRNPALINHLDGCAASVPITVPGNLPVGMMVACATMADRNCLDMAASIEAALSDK